MLPNVDWMVPLDALICMFLSDHRWRFPATPKSIAMAIGTGPSNASQRIGLLNEAGLLEKVDEHGYYRITELGERYALGETTKEELESVDPT